LNDEIKKLLVSAALPACEPFDHPVTNNLSGLNGGWARLTWT
jgi:hypothetical protein